MTTSITDGWAAVRHVANWRVVLNAGPKAKYHRGDNGAVRVYRDEDPARRRADILNGKAEGGSQKAEVRNNGANPRSSDFSTQHSAFSISSPSSLPPSAFSIPRFQGATA